MNNQPHVGLSLVNKAPLGLLVTTLIALVAYLVFELDVMTLLYSLAGGLVCATILIAYWSGKGGAFFIIGVSIPLILIVLTPLATMAALLYLISGFFFGFCFSLLIYKLISKQKQVAP